MRVRALFALGVLVPTLVVASACSSHGGTGDESTSSASAAPSDPPAAQGPELPADTSVAAPVDRALLPTVEGEFGKKPAITMPSTPPPDSLQRVVLSEGDGPVLEAGEQVMVNYLGQVWGGDVFDNSYDRGTPMLARIGGAQRTMVVGWDVGLRGVSEGSRVLLSFPPRDGYGVKGRAPKISGTDTLVFVIDVVRVLKNDLGGDPNAELQSLPEGLPEVGGELGSKPTVTVPVGLAEPTGPKATVIARGSGEPAQPGNLLVQFVLTTWDNSHTETSWPEESPATAAVPDTVGPQTLPVSMGSLLGVLLNIPIGSRVLLTMPPNVGAEAPALAWVIDIVAQQDLSAPVS